MLFLHSSNAIQESTEIICELAPIEQKSEDILYELRDITVTYNPNRSFVSCERAICDGYTI